MKPETMYKNLILRARTPEALTRHLFLLEARDDLESRMELLRRSIGRHHVGKYRQAIQNIDRMLKRYTIESSEPLPEPIETHYQEWLAQVPDPEMLQAAENYMESAPNPKASTRCPGNDA